MDRKQQYIQSVIGNLNQLQVQGVRNMHIVVESVKILEMLADELKGEEKQDVQPDAE